MSKNNVYYVLRNRVVQTKMNDIIKPNIRTYNLRNRNYNTKTKKYETASAITPIQNKVVTRRATKRKAEELETLNETTDDITINQFLEQILNKIDNKKKKINNLKKQRTRTFSELTVDDIEVDLDIDLSKPCPQHIWNFFNEFNNNHNKLPKRSRWVSATKIKNYLLNDPVLDYYDLYYDSKGLTGAISSIDEILKRKNEIQRNSEELNVLFAMGNKFEEEVMKYLRENFTVKKVADSYKDVRESYQEITLKHMKDGVPIIEQAVLYNRKNMTFGCADILVRSDYLNTIVCEPVLNTTMEQYKAPKLKGNYHYVVIDIKWTTQHLCCNGYNIRNSARFPAYKGQLAIYNAALGQLQGYTPSCAYVLAKSWKFVSQRVEYRGYNCFDRLGVIDYADRDIDYIERSKDAIDWIRDVRLNGSNWKCIPPSVPSLYPNMCNRYSGKFSSVKKTHAKQIKELTTIWMIGPRNRFIGHDNGVFKYTDKNCNARNLGIYGSKVAPIVDQIIKINRNENGKTLIKPTVIGDNLANWQNKLGIEFFIDFESLNDMFYKKDMNLENSKCTSDVIFMIGIAYEEDNDIKYKAFYMNDLSVDEEQRVFKEFMNFIEFKINEHMEKYNIKNRNLCTARMYHWSPAEIIMMKHFENRSKGKLKVTDWLKTITCIDFCKVFKNEPIVIKGVFGFGLKEIATKMHQHKMINTKWEEVDAPANGFEANIQGCQYYAFMDKYNEMSDTEKKHNIIDHTKYLKMFASIIYYNRVDCVVVWEIVNYFRNNYAFETLKKKQKEGLIDKDVIIAPEALEI